MSSKNKRISINVDAETEARVKAAAASRGVSVEQFCLDVIERESHEPSLADSPVLPEGKRVVTKEDLETLFAKCDELTQGIESDTDSSDLIREAREERHRDMENLVGFAGGNGISTWGKPPFTEEAARQLIALRDEISQGRVSSTDSAALIREARKRRTRRLEEIGGS